MTGLVGLLRAEWRRALVVLGLGVAATFGGLGLMGTAAYLISRAAEHPPTVLLLLVPIATVRFFSLLKAGGRFAERMRAHDVTLRLLARLKVAVFRRLAASGLPGWRLRARGDWLSRLSRDVDRLDTFYLAGIVPGLVLVVTGLVGSLVLAHFVPVAGVINLAGILLAGVVLPGAVARLELARQGTDAVADQEARLSADLIDIVEGLPEVVLNGVEATVAARLSDRGARLAARERRLDRLEAVLTGGAVAAVWGAAIGVLAAGAVRVAHGGLSVPVLALLVFVTVASLESVLPLTGAVRAFVETARAAQRVLPPGQTPTDRGDQDDREAGSDRGDRRETGSAGRSPIRRRPGIVVWDLSVRYDDDAAWVLQDLAFQVPPGSHVAVVGPSGSGKSTLLGVLAGLVPYRSGHVWLDGQEIADMEPARLHELLTVITDRAHLFRVSVAENLALANPSASRARLVEALERVGMAARILALPAGLDTRLGDVEFSGGELRRLQLARVFLRETPYVFLDEPLVGLDPGARVAVSQELYAWAAGRTVIYVTHDPPGPAWTFDAAWRVDAGALAAVDPSLIGQAPPPGPAAVWDLAGP
jgi:ATP-binding cassette subfamily C protein CydC